MHELHTEIHIDATAEDVWRVLTDTEAYPSWNPFVTNVEGTYRQGDTLRVTLEPEGGKAMVFKPTVTAVEPERSVTWLGHLLVRGVFDGEHRFEIHDDDSGGVRFVQAERFGGVLVPFLKKNLDGATRAGFAAMNRAMKARVETAV